MTIKQATGNDVMVSQFGEFVPTTSTITQLGEGSASAVYVKADEITIHFPEIHTIDKMQRIHRAVGKVAKSTLGGYMGDALILTVRRREFVNALGGTLPAARSSGTAKRPVDGDFIKRMTERLGIGRRRLDT